MKLWLPVVLSSELEGSDIEYYYRQNGEIADFDLSGILKELPWSSGTAC